MRRRRLLALLSATAAAGTAGCLDAAWGPTDGPDGGTDAPAGTTTESPAGDASDTTFPGERDGDFPPRDDDVDRVVWASDVDDPSGRLVLEPEVGSDELPRGASATFTLHNRSDRRFDTNFYDWGLYRREDGRWHRVAPRFVNQPLMRLDPGDSHAWDLTASSAAPDDRVPTAGGTESVSVRPVGGGTYAFAVDGSFPDQTATPTYEHKTMVAARFELTGPDLTLEPSAAVEAVERDGDVVRVTATGRGSEDARQATYVLSRASEAEAVDTMITEQAYRRWPLRDALAHAEEGVEAVRLRTSTSSHPPFGVHDDDPPAFVYDGTPWRVTVEDVEETD